MNNLLTTDAYKFSMAKAGKPSGTETFYYSHRRGGPHYMPIDVGQFVKSLLPVVVEEDFERLAAMGWAMGGEFREAIRGGDQLEIKAIPKGGWFSDRAPAFSITGPSALVSWLEPTLLQLNFQVQIATVALTDPELLARMVAKVTCRSELDIVRSTLDAVGVPAPDITVASEQYYEAVRLRARALVGLLGDPARAFEVGMRAASSAEQHDLALAACKAEGVTLTSNVDGAARLGLKAVGTMGHEHVQRYGDDALAFTAMRDRLDTPVSYLLDTFSTLDSGLPAAYRLIAQEPERPASVRFDSGDKVAQYRVAVKLARQKGIDPIFILEDGFDLAQTERFEALRRELGVDPARQLYGYGGHLVRPPWPSLSRDRVAAVWKLSNTGGAPTMKFADESEEGKRSLPGLPVLCKVKTDKGYIDVAAQAGELLDSCALTDQAAWRATPVGMRLSPATLELVELLGEKRLNQVKVEAA